MSIKAPKPSKDLVDAALAVFAARAAVETLTPIIEKIQSDIVSKNVFMFVDRYAHRAPNPEEARQPQRLTDFGNAYMLDEADQATIYAMLEDEYNKAGFTENRPFGHCPLLIAQSLEMKANILLIETAQNFHPALRIGDVAYLSTEKRSEYIELILRYVGAAVDLNRQAAYFTQKAA